MNKFTDEDLEGFIEQGIETMSEMLYNDAYSFNIDEDETEKAYNRMYELLAKRFNNEGIN